MQYIRYNLRILFLFKYMHNVYTSLYMYIYPVITVTKLISPLAICLLTLRDNIFLYFHQVINSPNDCEFVIIVFFAMCGDERPVHHECPITLCTIMVLVASTRIFRFVWHWRNSASNLIAFESTHILFLHCCITAPEHKIEDQRWAIDRRTIGHSIYMRRSRRCLILSLIHSNSNCLHRFDFDRLHLNLD